MADCQACRDLIMMDIEGQQTDLTPNQAKEYLRL